MALDIFSRFATDESLEENGAWRDIGDGAKLLVARAGNRKFGKALAREVNKHQATLNLGDDAADAKSDEIMASVTAEAILLGWEGVSFKGEELPYSFDNAKKLLGIKEFRKLVTRLSEELEAYKVKEVAEAGER